jgi:hypothetical protein
MPRSSTYTFRELGNAEVKSDFWSGESEVRVVMAVLNRLYRYWNPSHRRGEQSGGRGAVAQGAWRENAGEFDQRAAAR